ncbi:MAG: hypothetical protein MHM6MM_002342 [Cercozoa sp. M6MM]
MAEKLLEKNQFSYSANANLVLQRYTGRRLTDVPTGVAETLSHRSVNDLRKSMGSRAAFTQPSDLVAKMKRDRKERGDDAREQAAAAASRASQQAAVRGVVSVASAEFQDYYVPTNEEARQAWGLLLSFLSQHTKLTSHDDLASAADEVLHIMKDEESGFSPADKKNLVDELLFGKRSKLQSDEYSRLQNMLRKIRDFQSAATTAAQITEGEMKEEMGEKIIPLQLDDQEDVTEGDERLRTLRDGHEFILQDKAMSDDEHVGEEEELEVDETERRQMLIQASKDALASPTTGSGHFDVREVGAHWLQRQITHYCEIDDPAEAQKLADEAFTIIEENLDDERGLENELFALLPSGEAEFLQVLVDNAREVLWAMKLARAEGDREQRALLEGQMMNDPTLAKLLATLRTASMGSTAVGAMEDKLSKDAKQLQERVQQRETTLEESEDVAVAQEVTTEGPEWMKTRPAQMLNLEALKFGEGGHTQTNAGDFTLPEGTVKLPHKGWIEYQVPRSQTKRVDASELVKISSLPKWAQPAFSDLTEKFGDSAALNAMQSQVFGTALNSAENMLVCAPTGAGKTNVALLSMLREVGRHRNRDDFLQAFKVVYVAPMKSLVREITLKFRERLACYGMKVRELSGDQQLTRQQIDESSVIVTTPEKFDVVTRKDGLGARSTLLSRVTLLIIDEIHLLHDERGPVLEAIVARSLRHSEDTGDLTRIVGLSATLPNYRDVAVFLRVDLDTGLHHFGSEYRPVPLTQRFVGVTLKRPYKQFQMMNDVCYDLVKQNAENGQQVLVFVHSRKDTFNVAKMIVERAREDGTYTRLVPPDSDTSEILRETVEECHSKHLKEILSSGVAIHHAGMTKDDRGLVEDLFLYRHAKVLVSTATLAWGVNLPAHAVIIKGTKVYNPEKGDWVELSMLDVLQMLGRAGRPGLDQQGDGTIITTHRELRYYMSLINEQLPVESQLVSRLCDLLNAEIVAGFVRNVDEAVNWLSYTYLFVRMLQNPSLYGVADAEDAELKSFRADLVHTAAVELHRAGLIRYDKQTRRLVPTSLGRVAANFYLTYGTLKTFREHLKPHMHDLEMWDVFTLAEEFRHMSVREEERLELAQLADKVPIPLLRDAQSAQAKVNVLLQSYVARLRLDNYALSSDMTYVTQSAARLMRAMLAVALERRWAQAARVALDAALSVEHRQWACESPLRQVLRSIRAAAVADDVDAPNLLPDDVVRRLEKLDFDWRRLLELTPAALGELLQFPRLAKDIHRAVHLVPNVRVDAKVEPITRSLLRVHVTLQADFQWHPAVHGKNCVESFHLWVEDGDGATLLYRQTCLLSQRRPTRDDIVFCVPIVSPMPPQYFVRLRSDRWLGVETVVAVSFRHMLLPDKDPAPTQLVDIRPVSLSGPSAEQVMPAELQTRYAQCGVRRLNALQTQCRKALCHTDENVLIAAPNNSGKTLLAELAIFRALERFGTGHSDDEDEDGAFVVYLTSRRDLAQMRFVDWKLKFQQTLGISVGLLAGADRAEDVRTLNACRIIVAAAADFELLSRNWHRRSAERLQRAHLLLLDDLELLGGKDGPPMEVAVSRMRYIAESAENEHMRLVGLAACVSNAHDLGTWLGADPRTGTFVFAPSTRPIPLRLALNAGFEQMSTRARRGAMVATLLRQADELVPESDGKKPAPTLLVFVPTGAMARRVAKQFVARAIRDDDPQRFGGASDEEIEKDPSLQALYNESDDLSLQYARCGAACWTHDMVQLDKDRLVALFFRRRVRVLAVEFDASHELPYDLRADQAVVVLSDGGASLRLALAHVARMLGRAQSAASVLCSPSLRELLAQFMQKPVVPVESSLPQALHDYFLSEVCAGTLESMQDAVNLLTWSFLFTRLPRNPNYYHLAGRQPEVVSMHLSELVQQTLEELQEAKCIDIRADEDAMEDEEAEERIEPLNLGRISNNFGVSYETIEAFDELLQPTQKLRGILQVLSCAADFESLLDTGDSDRAKLLGDKADDEEDPAKQLRIALRKLAKHLPHRVAGLDAKEKEQADLVPLQVNVLLQSHMSRIGLRRAASRQREDIVERAVLLLDAMVNVLSSNGWLTPALATIEMMQMLIQGQWDTDSPLLQLPYFDKERAARATKLGIKGVFDLLEKDDERDQVLSDLSEQQIEQVAEVCNSFPNVELQCRLADDEVPAGEDCVLQCILSRDDEEEEDEDEGEEREGPRPMQPPVVHAPRFPREHRESWYVVVGDTKTNALLAVKKVAFRSNPMRVKVPFEAPEQEGKYNLKVYLMCDSFLGADVDESVKLRVLPPAESDEDSE